jgi:tRNA-Thr(GGU) m(6)t(6)A37 methyltransferase TsaA
MASTLQARVRELELQLAQRTEQFAELPRAPLETLAIGTLRSCFKERNGTPRQGLHAPHSRATLRLDPGCGVDAVEALTGLEQFSHVWLIFVFHENTNKPRAQKAGSQRRSVCKAKVHPPQMAGGSSGLFATRTPHRPNPIGLSVCILDGVAGDTISLRGVDLIDGTPILDIKPYHPIDIVTGAHFPDWVSAQFPESGLTPLVPSFGSVQFKDPAASQLSQLVRLGVLEFYSSIDEIMAAVSECVRLDPRRTEYRKRSDDRAITFAFCFDRLNVVCEMGEDSENCDITQVEYWPHGKAYHLKHGPDLLTDLSAQIRPCDIYTRPSGADCERRVLSERPASSACGLGLLR